jgi:hypothetical protein
MIALQENRAGLIQVGIELTASGFSHFHIVLDFDSVQRDGNLVAFDGRFDLLPLAWSA